MKKILCLLIFLYGCGGAWNHAYKTQSDFQADSYDCEYKAKMYARAGGNVVENSYRPSLTSGDTWGTSFGNAIARKMDEIPEYNRCMESKGYYRK